MIDATNEIHPRTPVASLDRDYLRECTATFPLALVRPVLGMSSTFIARVVGKKRQLTGADVLALLDQDAFAETFVPRSRIPAYLMERQARTSKIQAHLPTDWEIIRADAREYAERLPPGSIDCIVTSTPYWAMRVYKGSVSTSWADGETCPYGLEQTPEAFVRHTIELMLSYWPALSINGSIWWNIGDTYNTRTQLRESSAEALHAMQGGDKRRWKEQAFRRYSAGHSYLFDGEQIGIPSMIAQRASRIGFYVKSTVTWAKTAALPEPQHSRVSKQLEYVIHLSKTRAPKFNKSAYLQLATSQGGRNPLLESAKLSDVWVLGTSTGGGGHGAQFPLALPGRCIALSTDPGDVVLDPFVGSGTTILAALTLNRRAVGVELSDEYAQIGRSKVAHFRASVPRWGAHQSASIDLAEALVEVEPESVA